MELIELIQEDPTEIKNFLLEQYDNLCELPAKNPKNENTSKEISNDENYLLKETERALIVSGDTLIEVSKHPDLIKILGLIGLHCEAVLCCRVSPKQKAEIVKMIRKALPNARTLSIGDGANDVNMIIEAHIGVGIKGVEGQQAARASDYSIGEFKHLKRLLIVYGRESYRKNSLLVLYTFWKNILVVFPQFWYALAFNNFSGMTLYDKFLYQFVNLLYTSLPIIFFAIWDVEVKDTHLESDPKFYKAGLRRVYFNFWLFVLWSVRGLLSAFFIMIFASFLDFQVQDYGTSYNFWGIGMTVFVLTNIMSNTNILVISNSYFCLNIIALIGSVLLLIISFFLVSSDESNLHFGLFTYLFRNPNFYFCFVGSFVSVTVFDFIWDIAQRILFFEFLGITFKSIQNDQQKLENNKDYMLLSSTKMTTDLENSNIKMTEDLKENKKLPKKNQVLPMKIHKNN